MRNTLLILLIILTLGCEKNTEVPKVDTETLDSLSNWIVYDSIPSNISDIEFDSRQNLWAITSNGGLYKFEDSVFISQLKMDDYNFTCFNFDSLGNLWIGTDKHMIIKYKDSKKQLYQLQSKYDAVATVREIEPQTEKIIWVYTDSELLKFSTTDWYVMSKDSNQTINDDKILDNVYLTSGGIIEYNDSEWRMNGFQAHQISSIDFRISNQFDSYNTIKKIIYLDNYILILSRAGLFNCSKSTTDITSFTDLNDIIETDVKYDVEIKDDEYWVGSSAGLIKYSETNGSVRYNQFNSKLESDLVWKMAVNTTGLWIINENRLINIK